jgi:hypothetical protein
MFEVIDGLVTVTTQRKIEQLTAFTTNSKTGF